MTTSSIIGLGLLLLYTIFVWIPILFYAKKTNNKETFLTADREVPMFIGALSIAGSWIWAPALFVAAQKAYQQGIVGLFWFLFMNVLCLIIFAPFAKKIREKMPQGFTLSSYMRDRFSKRVHIMYLIQMLGLSISSVAVQLLAGGITISLLTGIPFWIITIILSLIAFSYSFTSGLKASLASDWVELGIIFLVMLTIVPMVIIKAGGFQVVLDGIGGLSGEFSNPFNAKGIEVFLTFGLSTSIGLLAGPFGDQTYWQRAFSIKKDKVFKSFLLSAPIFAIVPIVLSLLGFVAAGIGFQTGDPSTVNLQIIREFLPDWTLIPFTLMLLGGLIGTVDSQINAITSLFNDFNKTKTVNSARIWMLFSLIIAILIANIPNMQVLYLFMLYGTLRASTLLPTVISLISDRVSEKGMFWGILLSILIGLPVFAYGNYKNITPMIWGGSLLTIFLSGFITFIFSKFSKKGIK